MSYYDTNDGPIWPWIALIVAVLLLIAFSLVRTNQQEKACEARGGVLVRGQWVMECVTRR